MSQTWWPQKIHTNIQRSLIYNNSKNNGELQKCKNLRIFSTATWLVSGRSRTKCFPAQGGDFIGCAFQVHAMMLHGEYGGEEEKLVSRNENLLYGYDYVFNACKQQGLVFHLESLAPSHSVPVDGYFGTTFRVTNRMLGEGILWGVGRSTTVDATTRWFELW